MDCKKESNLKRCSCSASCSRKGICCDCVAYHLSKRQVPGCFFDKDGEATWDRSFEHFAKLINEKRL
ncbi:MAG: DUF6485 family protein [Planctomycetia bacterium]|nr:DUF6485 family protein [Planctomycetia bacterium]